MKIPFNKYRYYELSVQSPERDAAWFNEAYVTENLKEAIIFREDFCGTFKTSCEWIKLGQNKKSISIDLSKEPLEYGINTHLKKFSSKDKKRITIINSNVLNVSKPKADIIVANNFSFFVFKTRSELLAYFKNTLNSLNHNGMAFFEIAGGPGMIEQVKESKTVWLNSKQSFKYTWDQQAFNPISNEGLYAIHFKRPGEKAMKNVFLYDWRIWNIREIRDALEEVGFDKTIVYWEKCQNGRSTDDYIPTEKADNDHAYTAHVAGVRW